jgi:hypothetical protein
VPHINELQEKYADQGLVIIGVHSQDRAETMADGVQQHGINYIVAADTEGKTVAAYHVDSYPDYYFIDRAGNLRIVDCANANVEEAIQLLLAEDAE